MSFQSKIVLYIRTYFSESRNTVASSVLGSEVQSTLETAVELTDKEKINQEWEELIGVSVVSPPPPCSAIFNKHWFLYCVAHSELNRLVTTHVLAEESALKIHCH